jgi:hypothetical protein
MLSSARIAALLLSLALAAPARAWDAFGHRLVTRLALEDARRTLGADAPDWLFTPHATAMIADQAVTPDRWRSTRLPQLTHLNNPDHYLDIEDLEPYSLTLRTIPPLRHEYVRVLSIEREKPTFKGPPIGRLDPEHVREYPGFLPHAALETWGKALSALRTARTLERLDDPGRAPQLDMARASAIYNVGILAHYIGDAAQPLHTTKHHHGWIGDNPKGYTTDRGIHAYIDGGVIRNQRITIDDVRAAPRPTPPEAAQPWDLVLAELERSFALVEPLYELKRTGDLDREPGRRFIVERLADASATLAALYTLAWRESAVTQKDVDDFLRYDGPRDAP